MRSMEVGRYRHNNEGFNKKFTYQMSINRGRTTTTQDDMQALWEFFHLFSFSLGKKV